MTQLERQLTLSQGQQLGSRETLPITKDHPRRREFRSIWKSTGMYEKYGVYNSTRNRKRVATVMAENHPKLSESVAKQLCHSVTTEKIYYDMGVGPGNAIKYLH